MATSLSGLSAAWAGGLVPGARGQEAADFAPLDEAAHLPALSHDEIVRALSHDWLVTPAGFATGIFRTGHADEICMTNGLIRRTWRLRPNAATVGFDNLMTGASILRRGTGSCHYPGLAGGDAGGRIARTARRRPAKTRMVGPI